ncbi:MAG TPA: methionine aminotransferase [Flavobacteriaceae bacterium]|nr:methionine aminotransferase [Flavobacteriaceae bacterium]
MNLNHNSKLPNLKTTIFTVIGKLARKHDAINLSQGFPNFPADPNLIGLVNKAMKEGHNQYAPLAGVFDLRETLCEKMNRLYGSDYHPETDITLTAGATQAIFTAISAFIKKDDEVIVFKPAYDCYEPAIELNGGKPVLIQIKAPEYQINWEEVKQKITPKTKMVLINTPHNPSGKMLSENDMQTLESLLDGTDILLLSDEVYEHITFDGKQHQSAAKFPKLAERALITYSFGKTFHVTGWKMGYCVAPKILMQEFQKVHQYNVFCVNHPIQIALNKYLQKPEHYLKLSEFYQQKRDLFLNLIKGSRFEYTPSEGTYFQLLDFSKITQEHDLAFTERLIKDHKLAAIPVSGFSINEQPARSLVGDDKMLRFCFAKTDETLKKAAEIICEI